MARRRPSRGSARWSWPVLGGAGVVSAAVVAVIGIGIGQVTGGQACAAPLPAGGAVVGTATHYILSGTGNCSYPAPPADGLFVALSPAEYGGGTACGGYLEVSGPHGSVRAEVIDQCPPCAAGHIDLSEAAFARIAPLSAGLVSVTYRPVTDPPIPAPIAVRVKEGSSRYWLALLAMNTGNPLASIQVETAADGWQALVRTDYDYWIASSGAGAGPFTVRLTDTAGHRVTVRGISLDPGVVQATGTRMYGAGTSPGAGTGPTPTASRSASVSAAPGRHSPARRRRAPKSGGTVSATPTAPTPASRVSRTPSSARIPDTPSIAPSC